MSLVKTIWNVEQNCFKPRQQRVLLHHISNNMDYESAGETCVKSKSEKKIRPLFKIKYFQYIWIHVMVAFMLSTQLQDNVYLPTFGK